MAWDNSMDYQHLHDLRWCCGPRWSFEKGSNPYFWTPSLPRVRGVLRPGHRFGGWVCVCLSFRQLVVHHPANPVGQWQHVTIIIVSSFAFLPSACSVPLFSVFPTSPSHICHCSDPWVTSGHPPSLFLPIELLVLLLNQAPLYYTLSLSNYLR